MFACMQENMHESVHVCVKYENRYKHAVNVIGERTV